MDIADFVYFDEIRRQWPSSIHPDYYDKVKSFFQHTTFIEFGWTIYHGPPASVLAKLN